MSDKRTKRIRFKRLKRTYASRIQKLNPSKTYKKSDQQVREGNHYWDHSTSG